MKLRIGRLPLLATLSGAGLLLPLLAPQLASAVSGQCALCHTMHHSQNNATPANGKGTPQEKLLLDDCIGCHTTDNTDPNSVAGRQHYVLNTDGGTYGTNGVSGNTSLAGGDFYYTTTAYVPGTGTAANRGHGVSTIPLVDADAFAPPGYDAAIAGPLGIDASIDGSNLTCAGDFGCHGDHSITTSEYDALAGAHHANGTGALFTATTVGNSFRFLLGIYGVEDADRELTVTDAGDDHNQYFGIDRATDNPAGEANGTNTISYLCGQCHGKFHSQSGATVSDGAYLDAGLTTWGRHPTDLDMNGIGGEFVKYGQNDGSGAANSYAVIAPVASSRTADYDWAGGTATAGDAIITCISCHRAHATPHMDILRWDYAANCIAGSTSVNCGCFECHSAKDGTP